MSTRPLSFIIALVVIDLISPIVHSAPGAHGPNGEHLSAAGTDNVSSLARLPDGSVNVPKLAQRRMAIRTVMGHEAEHPLTVELNGRVAIDPNAGGQVQTPLAGRIVAGPNGLPVIGQRVKKGQILVHVYPVPGAIERGNQQAQLADLRANRLLAQQRAKRLKSLEGTVPGKEIEAAQAELTSLTGRERAVSASLGGKEAIAASASGAIAAAHVLTGQIVEARALLFEIVDPNQMMVEALTTDVTLAGRIGGASLLGFPTVGLTLIGGGRTLRDGALPLSFRARGQDVPLAVGLPVTVVATLTEKIKGVALPAEALARSPANETIVWIKAGAERFIAQPVEVKPLNATTIVVVKGLAPDNRVVVSGTALINQIR